MSDAPKTTIDLPLTPEEVLARGGLTKRDEISERLQALMSRIEAQFALIEPKLAEAMASESKNERALNEMTDRLHHLDHRIAELMRRIAALEDYTGTKSAATSSSEQAAA